MITFIDDKQFSQLSSKIKAAFGLTFGKNLCGDANSV